MTDTDAALLDEVEELAVDETDGEPEAAEGKAKREKAPAKPKIEFGATWLAAHLSETLGKQIDGKAVRIVLRALTAKGVLEHPKGGRYEFTGAEDPRVALVVAEFQARAEGKAARAASKGTRKSKAAATEAGEPVEDEDAPVEELDDLD